MFIFSGRNAVRFRTHKGYRFCILVLSITCFGTIRSTYDLVLARVAVVYLVDIYLRVWVYFFLVGTQYVFEFIGATILSWSVLSI